MANKPTNLRVWAENAAPADKTDPGVSKYSSGWAVEVPTHADFNFIQNQMSQMLVHINERGVPEWDTATAYKIGALVLATDNQLWRCLVDNVAIDPAGTLDPTTPEWGVFSAGGIVVAPAIPFHDILKIYVVNDLVSVAGRIYRCGVGNGPAAFDAIKWEDATAISIFSEAVPYTIGEAVLFNDLVYTCIVATARAPFNPIQWKTSTAAILNHSTTATYVSGDMVLLNGRLYRCWTPNGPETFTPAKWADVAAVTTWSPAGIYAINDAVYQGGIIHRCVTANGPEVFDPAKWVSIDVAITNHSSTGIYAVDTLVVYIGEIYRCRVANGPEIFAPSKWSNIAIISSFSDDAAYAVGEMVVFNGTIYICIAIVAPGVFDPLEWNTAEIAISLHSPTKDYNNGAMILQGGALYRCWVTHTAEIFNPLKWANIAAVQVWSANGVYAVDELVSNAGVLHRCILANGPGVFDPLDWEGYIADVIYSAATEIAMLALTGIKQGDICERTDLGTTFKNRIGLNAVMSDWYEIQSKSRYTFTSVTTLVQLFALTGIQKGDYVDVYDTGLTYRNIAGLNAVIADWQPINNLKQPVVQSSYNQAPASGGGDVDFKLGDMVEITAGGDLNISFANFIAGKVCTCYIDAINWGAFTITFTGSVVFNGGAAPTFTTAGRDRLIVIKDAAEEYGVFVIGADI